MYSYCGRKLCWLLFFWGGKGRGIVSSSWSFKSQNVSWIHLMYVDIRETTKWGKFICLRILMLYLLMVRQLLSFAWGKISQKISKLCKLVMYCSHLQIRCAINYLWRYYFMPKYNIIVLKECTSTGGQDSKKSCPVGTSIFSCWASKL